MKPIDFIEGPVGCYSSNVTYAKDQPEYLPLPAYRSPNGCVTTCWQLTWRERLALLFRGRLFLSLLTFNQPLQPIKIGTSFIDVQ